MTPQEAATRAASQRHGVMQMNPLPHFPARTRRDRATLQRPAGDNAPPGSEGSTRAPSSVGSGVIHEAHIRAAQANSSQRIPRPGGDQGADPTPPGDAMRFPRGRPVTAAARLQGMK